MDTQVLVVGAGPTGLTLAAGLLRRGVQVRIVDKGDGNSPHSKAITLWPRALETCQAIGAGAELFAAGVKLRATTYWTGDRRIGRMRLRPLPDTRFPVPISLPQPTTERILRDAVGDAGGKIEYDRALTTLAQDQGGVTAQLADGEVIRAGWLVGCDGAHSTVRERTGVPFTGATYPQAFVLVDGEYDTACAPDESYYLMGPGGVIVVVGLPGGAHRVFASLPPGAQVADPVDAVRQLLAQQCPLPMRLVRATGSGVFQIHRRMVDRMRIGRVLLAGDAAHVHSPAGGHGLNTGVQDAGALAWRLAGVLRRELAADGLDDWAAERLFVARRVLAETDAQTRMWLLRGWRRRVRDLALHSGLRTGLIERVVPRRMAQFDLAVPIGDPAGGRSRTGTRVPDVLLDNGTRLYDQLVDPVLAVDDPRVLRAVGAPRGTRCLVRPDGVLAGITTTTMGEDQR